MVRFLARWLAVVAAAFAMIGAPGAQAPPDAARPTPSPTPGSAGSPASAARPNDASQGIDVTGETPDAARSLRAEAMTLFGRLDDDRAAVWVASGGGPGRPQDRLLPEPLRPDRGLDLPLPPPPRDQHPDALLPRAGDRRLPLLDRHRRRVGPPRAEVAGRQAARRPRRERLRLRRHRPRPGRLPGDHRRGRATPPAASASAPPSAVPLSGPTASAPAGAPAALVLSAKKLSGKERKKALEALPDRYRQFLTDVEPILTDVEEATFLRLSSDYQRDRFIDDFWKRRSVDSDGQRVAFKDVYELRLQTVQGEVPERQHGPGADLPRQRPARRIQADRLHGHLQPDRALVLRTARARSG